VLSVRYELVLRAVYLDGSFEKVIYFDNFVY
jgi:hypothetical protein